MGRNAVLIPNEQTNGSAAKILSTRSKLINYASPWHIHRRAVTQRWFSFKFKSVIWV